MLTGCTTSKLPEIRYDVDVFAIAGDPHCCGSLQTEVSSYPADPYHLTRQHGCLDTGSTVENVTLPLASICAAKAITMPYRSIPGVAV